MGFLLIGIACSIVALFVIWKTKRVTIEIAHLAVFSFIALQISKGGYSTPQIMGVLYPALASAFLVYGLLKIRRHYFIAKNREIMIDGLLHVVQSVSLGILALVTGDNPIADFDILRPHLVEVRFLMLVIIAEASIYQIRLHESWRSISSEIVRDRGMDTDSSSVHGITDQIHY